MSSLSQTNKFIRSHISMLRSVKLFVEWTWLSDLPAIVQSIESLIRRFIFLCQPPYFIARTDLQRVMRGFPYTMSYMCIVICTWLLYNYNRKWLAEHFAVASSNILLQTLVNQHGQHKRQTKELLSTCISYDLYLALAEMSTFSPSSFTVVDINASYNEVVEPRIPSVDRLLL